MLIQPDRTIRKAARRRARLHRMRILVVEDEVDLAHTLHTGLTEEDQAQMQLGSLHEQ